MLEFGPQDLDAAPQFTKRVHNNTPEQEVIVDGTQKVSDAVLQILTHQAKESGETETSTNTTEQEGGLLSNLSIISSVLSAAGYILPSLIN